MTDTPVIIFENVTIAYYGRPALESVNLEVRRGEFLGIIGPNGGGKTTLLRTILGLLRPTAGKVIVLGQSPEQARSRIGYVPQTSIFERHFPIDVWDVVMMGRLSRLGMFKRPSDSDRAKVKEVLDFVGLYDLRKRKIGSLSGGQIQKAMVARAIVGEPELLLLDEPTSSFDVQSEKNLYGLLSSLNARMTILMVSHDIGAVSSHVTTLACLNRRLYHHGPKELQPQVIESVYGCPVDLIAHGTPHRVLGEHQQDKKES